MSVITVRAVLIAVGTLIWFTALSAQAPPTPARTQRGMTLALVRAPDTTSLPYSSAPPQRHSITPEDITGLRNPYNVQLSPDAQWVAFVIEEPAPVLRAGATRRETVWLIRTNGSGDPQRVSLAASDTSSNTSTPRWTSDSHTLGVLSDFGPDGSTQIFEVAVADEGVGAARRITSEPRGVEQFRWSPDATRLAYTTQDPPNAEVLARRAHTDAVRVDREVPYTRLWTLQRSGAREPLLATRDSLDVKQFTWAPDGQSLAVIGAPRPLPEDGNRLRLVTVDWSSGRVIRKLADGMSLTNGLRWSPDGRWISFTEQAPADFYASWFAVVSPSGGASHPLLKDEPLTVLSAEWAPDSRHLFVQTVEGTHQTLSTLDVERGTRTIITPLNTSQGDYGFSTNGREIAYFDQSPIAPNDVWFRDAQGQKRKLTNLNPQTARWLLGQVREVRWKNSVDGIQLYGVVVTPPGYVEGRRYPTVVQGHPGDIPWWTGFFGQWWSWAQLLASDGYVVFLPNYRGVTGQGWRLHHALGQWGAATFQDITDGVDMLVRDGIADPNALGIGGWSNGGHTTEWVIGHTTRFKAAVAESGHSDLFSLAGTSGEIRSGLASALGVSQVEGRALYEARSPISYVKRVTTPTLILHGTRDSGLPVGQGLEFYNALRTAGVETEMVIYPSEGHSIQSRGNQVDLLYRMLGWFDSHLRPESRRSRGEERQSR